MVLGFGAGSLSCPLIPRLGMVAFRGPVYESFLYLTRFHSRVISVTDVGSVHCWFSGSCDLKKGGECNDFVSSVSRKFSIGFPFL